ncbi:glycosyltransferase family 4 protein [Acidobacteria bacterium AB60]|nr:glycosyltransferase family 4 protein [Acidobacteria bacterium AB60]
MSARTPFVAKGRGSLLEGHRFRTRLCHCAHLDCEHLRRPLAVHPNRRLLVGSCGLCCARPHLGGGGTIGSFHAANQLLRTCIVQVGSQSRKGVRTRMKERSNPAHSRMHSPSKSTCPTVFMLDLWATLPYYVAHLCRALIASGQEVTIGSITYYLDRDCFLRFGLRNQAGALDAVGKWNLPKSLRRVLKLIEGVVNMLAWMWRFRRSRPSIVHIQFLPLLPWRLPVEMWFLRYCRRLGIRLVYTVHDALPHDTGERYKSIYRRLYQSVDRLICHSDAVRNVLEAEFFVPADRICVIPHGPFFYDCAAREVQSLRQRLAPNGECLVLWQGLIFPYKGIDFLLDSWGKVQDSRINARLVIAGTGNSEYLAEIKARASRPEIIQSVHCEFRFLPLEELIALYQACDIVVYPYKAITTSGALMTGITQGKPIIATRLPAFSEALRDGENAILVDYGDTHTMAEKIVSLVNSPASRALYGTAVRRLSLGESAWRDIAVKTLACYRSLEPASVSHSAALAAQ